MSAIIAEAKATFAKFVAANSSLAAIIAVVELLFDKIGAAIEADQRELEEFRTKAEGKRAEAVVRMQRLRAKKGSRTFANVREHADVTASRARSSSPYLEESIGGGGDCAREGARDTHENKLILEVDASTDPEEVAAEVEKIVIESGHWPNRLTEGWMRSAVVPQIAARLRAGFARNVILDAVRVAAVGHSDGNPISSFAFFNRPDGPIERAHAAAQRAHADATAQLTLPLKPPRFRTVKGGRNELDEHYKARRAAAAHSGDLRNAGARPPKRPAGRWRNFTASTPTHHAPGSRARAARFWRACRGAVCSMSTPMRSGSSPGPARACRSTARRWAVCSRGCSAGRPEAAGLSTGFARGPAVC